MNTGIRKKIKSSPRITLYCEYYKLLNSSLLRKTNRMGFLVSYLSQKKILKDKGIFFTDDLSLDTDILQANAQGLRTLWLLKKFKRQGKKTIIYAHATAEELADSFRIFHLLSNFYKKYLSYVYGLADAVICPSVYTANLLQREYGIPEEKTVFISNGVDVNAFKFDPVRRKRFRKEQRLSAEDTMIINLAMVIKKKGIETFVAMGKLFPEAVFVWCGKIFSGIFAPSVPSHSANVKFAGYVPDEKDAYAGADIFLFPSYEENQGISVLEAAAMGLPVVVRDIPVYSGWLRDGYHCLKAKSDEEFKKKLEIMIRNKDLRKQLGENARRMVEQDHSLEAVGKKLQNLYQKLLEKK